MSKKCMLLLLLLSILDQIVAQNLFVNPSFEIGIDGPSRLAKHWTNCGNKGYTPPDLHDSSDEIHYFKVKNNASQGNKYVSLVIREDQSTECISQILEYPLVPKHHYRISLDLCKSEQFRALKNMGTIEEVSFDSAADLEVYGLTETGEQSIIHVFTDIQNINWRSYSIDFVPNKEYTSIRFSLFYQFHRLLPYNGHILMDNLSLFQL